MTHREDRTLTLVRLMIGVLCAAAVLLIVLILNGSGLSETGSRMMATAIAVAIFSLTGVAGTTLAARRPELSAIGYLVAIASFAAFLAALAAIWSDQFQDNNWRVAVDLTLVAIGGGHASLLLGSARPDESDTVRLVRAGVILTIAILLLMAIVEISSRGEDLGWEPFGVLAVLYLLGTALLPLLRRIPASSEAAVAPAPSASGIDQVAIAVSDRASSDSFYRDVLGADVVPASDGGIGYRIGTQQLSVREPGSSVRPGGSELCLVWDGPAQAAIEHLDDRGIAVIAGPVARVGAHGVGTSVFCRDPDGSLIELISYG